MNKRNAIIKKTIDGFIENYRSLNPYEKRRTDYEVKRFIDEVTDIEDNKFFNSYYEAHKNRKDERR